MEYNSVRSCIFHIRVEVGATQSGIKSLSYATAFSFKCDSKKYLVTVAHFLDSPESELVTSPDGKRVELLAPKDLSQIDEIEIYYNGRWNVENVQMIGSTQNLFHGDDALVFIADNFLMERPYLTEVSLSEVDVGEKVHFIGFPGLQVEFREENNIRIPLTKCGYFSGTDKRNAIYIDGHNNMGFSGAPILVERSGNQTTDRFHVFGIVSGFLKEFIDGRPEFNGAFPSNSGLMFCSPIDKVIGIIDDNLSP